MFISDTVYRPLYETRDPVSRKQVVTVTRFVIDHDFLVYAFSVEVGTS